MLAELSSLRFGFRAMVPTWLLAGSHPQFFIRWGFPEELLPIAKCVSSDGWQENMLTGWDAPVLGNPTVEGMSYRFWSSVPTTRKSSTPSHKERGLCKTEYQKAFLDFLPQGYNHTILGQHSSAVCLCVCFLSCCCDKKKKTLTEPTYERQGFLASSSR